MGLHLSKNAAVREVHPSFQELVNEEFEFRSALDSFLSLEFTNEATRQLLEMNEEAFKIILDCKEDLWENRDLFELVQEFFHNSLETLNFCRCLRKSCESQLIIQTVIEENDNAKLSDFKAAVNQFSKEEISKLLKPVYKNRVAMLWKLQVHKSKLDQKLKRVKIVRKLSKVICIGTSAALFICSVLAAAMAAPPVAAAVAAASAIPLESIRRWLDSVFKGHGDKLIEHKKIIHIIDVGTCIAMKDLTDIQALVNRLQKDIDSLFQSTDVGVRGEETVKKNKKKLGVFKKSVHDLSDMVDKCSKGLIHARTLLADQITKPQLT